MDENFVAKEIVDACYQVHRALGPGLLESVYETVLAFELKKSGLDVRRQVPISITYENITFDEAFRADLVVEDRVIVELKSVDQPLRVFAPLRETQSAGYSHSRATSGPSFLNSGSPVRITASCFNAVAAAIQST